ncbi:methyltransferase domain-containing protein [uncultured Methanobrevibacter sp.]|uniref:methyltransferase domain-containing protein n=1 Tax=uncultured Methanobrevibacter sp. TaxID=253161 RepID=UPI0026286B0F
MHKNSYLKIEWFKENYLSTDENLKILNLASFDSTGEFDYKKIFDEKNWEYHSLDNKKDTKADIIVHDIYNWYEIEDDSYDVIFSSHFFEHLEFFWLTLSQMERVLKPNGIICIVVPSAGGKHDYHMDNCYRFHTGGLYALAKYIGFKIEYALVDENPEAKPYFEACLIARKP